MERVFEEHEMFERFNFSQMMLHYFKPCAPQKSQLSGMNATELYRLFLVHNPHSQLTSGIVHNILLMGGYVQRETGTEMELFAEVNEEAFIEAKREIQMAILKHITGPMEVKYRQIALGIKVRKVNDDGSYELINNPLNSVTVFISRWTLNRNDRYHFYLKPIHRSTLLEVYNFYRFICVTYGMDIVSKRIFYDTVEKMGYNITTGAVHGKAGNRYFKGLYIPQNTDDIKLSLDINAVVIDNGRTHWTKDNELLENYTEVLRENLKEENLRRMQLYGEPREKTSSEEQCDSLDFRRTIESIQTPICIPETTDAERKEVEERMASVITLKDTNTESKDSIIETTYDEKPEDESTDDEFDVTEDVIEDEPEEYADTIESEMVTEPEAKQPERSISDIIKPKTNRHIVKNSAAKRILSEFEPGGNTVAGSESIVSDEFSGGTEASFEEIAEAMKIPYKMNPSGFTVDVFAEWLDKMCIVCPDVRAYYKHIMPMIKE